VTWSPGSGADQLNQGAQDAAGEEYLELVNKQPGADQGKIR
jgi:hypothetical protein